MRSFVPLAVYCISLVSIQQLSAVRPDTNRLDLLNKLIGQREEISLSSGSQTNDVSTSSTTDQPPKRLSAVLKQLLASRVRSSPGLEWAEPPEASEVQWRSKRSPSQTRPRGSPHHPKNAQLMRVGCVLGTCQVQNLSHRLYQLIGQSGREESSPINPKSPHSFG